MGGHGGLNILPQKKWHVFNYDNRLKVELDQLHDSESKSKKEQQVANIQSERIFNTLREQSTDSLPPSDPKLPEGTKPGNPEYLREEQEKKDKVIMRSTLYLGQTVTHQDAPWYVKVPKPETTYDFQASESLDFYSIIPKTKSEHKRHKRERSHKKPENGKKKSVEEMREERIRREVEERKRAEELILQRGK